MKTDRGGVAQPLFENPEVTPVLDALEGEFPGLDAFFVELSKFFSREPEDFRRRIEKGLDPQQMDRWQKACRDWEEVGVLPDAHKIASDQQVAAVWVNPLFQAVLDHGAEFAPPPGQDLSEHIPEPLEFFDQLGERLRLFREARDAGEPYWKNTLRLVFPELYLQPFLQHRPLSGCDLACGWGRASLTMHAWEETTITGVDLAEAGLEVYRKSAESLGMADRISTVVGDLTALPLEDDSQDFFLAFDIFEHLTDATLAKVLAEILRTARTGALLYTEIPLHEYFPPITHIQDFSLASVVECFETRELQEKTFRLLCYRPEMPYHFTFKVDPVGQFARTIIR